MIGSELKALRLKLGMTIEQMAEELGIGWRMYYYVENGEKPLSKASAKLLENLIKYHPI